MLSKVGSAFIKRILSRLLGQLLPFDSLFTHLGSVLLFKIGRSLHGLFSADRVFITTVLTKSAWRGQLSCGCCHRYRWLSKCRAFFLLDGRLFISTIGLEILKKCLSIKEIDIVWLQHSSLIVFVGNEFVKLVRVIIAHSPVIYTRWPSAKRHVTPTSSL